MCYVNTVNSEGFILKYIMFYSLQHGDCDNEPLEISSTFLSWSPSLSFDSLSLFNANATRDHQRSCGS